MSLLPQNKTSMWLF